MECYLLFIGQWDFDLCFLKTNIALGAFVTLLWPCSCCFIYFVNVSLIDLIKIFINELNTNIHKKMFILGLVKILLFCCCHGNQIVTTCILSLLKVKKELCKCITCNEQHTICKCSLLSGVKVAGIRVHVFGTHMLWDKTITCMSKSLSLWPWPWLQCVRLGFEISRVIRRLTRIQYVWHSDNMLTIFEWHLSNFKIEVDEKLADDNYLAC